MRKVTDKVLDNCEKVERAAARNLKRTTTKSKMTDSEKKNLMAFIFGGGATSEVCGGAPIGTSMENPNKHSGKSSGKIEKMDTSHITEFEDRQKRGLSCRLKNVDYSVRIVDGLKVKTCTCCQKTWNINNFSKDSIRNDRLKQTCKDCDQKRNAARIYIPSTERENIAA